MSETYPGQMLPELQEKTTVDSNDLFYMVSSNASKKIKGSNLKAQMKPSDYTGATSSTNGANGLVPQPTTSDVDRFLKGDGTWGDISYAVGEASGSIATFSDGSELPMRTLKAYIEPQQDLHGYDMPWVGGAGKNKYSILIGADDWNGNADGSATDDNGTLVVTCTAGNNSGAYSKLSANIYDLVGQYSSDVTYSFDIKSNSSGNILIGYTDVGRKEINVTTSWQRVNISATAIGSNKVFVIYNKSGSAMEIQVKNFMFEIGSVAHPYEPYSNICPISGWTGTNVVRAGKNLSPYSNIANSSRSTPFLLPKGNYTFSFRLVGTPMYTTSMIRLVSGEDGIATKQVYWTTVGSYVSVQFTLTESTTVQIQSVNVTNDSGGHSADNIQIELDSQATTYEPYNGHTYTIQFTDGSNPLTVYGGYVDVVSGVLMVDRVITSYTDSDVSLHTGSISGVTYAKVPKQVNSKTYNNYSSEALTCNKFKNGNGTAIQGGVGLIRSDADTKHYFIGLEPGTTLEEAKEIINGTQLVYERATSQTYQLTAQQVKSLLGENNVWADTGDVDVHYVRDLTITIDDILSRLEALEG